MDRQLYKIIKKCRKNDRQAQFDLYHYCFDYLLAICFRYQRQREDAVSLLNDAFLKVLLNLEEFDAQKEFFPWAATLTVRTAIDQFRSQHNYRSNTDFVDGDSGMEAIQLGSAQRNILNQMSEADVKEMVFALPEKERMVFVLYEWEGYKHQEIAQKLDFSERSSKRFLQSAKQQLKKQLSQKQNLKKVI